MFHVVKFRGIIFFFSLSLSLSSVCCSARVLFQRWEFFLSSVKKNKQRGGKMGRGFLCVVMKGAKK